MATSYISNYFSEFYNSIPENQKVIFSIIILTIIIVLYSLFIWKYYKLLANKQILDLNLRQYNYSSHPIIEKILAMALYTLEYLIILPFLIIFWFAILSAFLLVLSMNSNTQQILLIAAAIIASIRITSYLNEDLSHEIAKLFPLAVLVVFAFGSIPLDSEIIIERFNQIPGLLNEVITFLIFIFVIEFLLRIIYSLTAFINSNDEVFD